MKTKLAVLAILIFATLLQPSSSGAFDFTYGYKTVLDANANQYVVGTQNVQKYDEGTPGASYWAPSTNDTAGLLTQRFEFSTPTALIHLYTQLASFNFGGGTVGATSLYGSTDGLSWELLLDNPTPSSIASYAVYDQNIPSDLLGTDTFWLQTRFLSHNSTIMAQSTHFGQGNSFNGFELNANLVPEPSTVFFGLFSSLVLALRRNRHKTIA